MIEWRYLTGEAEPASWALAVDEILMNKYDLYARMSFPEPTLRIYSCKSHCVLVGRFQNAEAEVDISECEFLGIEVNRRMTGSGTVIMGEQQLMVTLLSSANHPLIPADPTKILRKLARGVITGLTEFGISAEYRPKNDIVIKGRKIGGSAMWILQSGALMYQASVLLDFDIPLMLRVLKISPEKVSDKPIKSHEERMTTLQIELGRKVKIEEAREAIRRGFERTFRMRAKYIPLTDTEREQAECLRREKYESKNWIFQYQPLPDMTGNSIKKTRGGLVRAYVALAGNTIKSVLITGDFVTGYRIINDLEAALKWERADRKSVSRIVNAVMQKFDHDIHGISAHDLSELINAAVEDAKMTQSEKR